MSLNDRIRRGRLIAQTHIQNIGQETAPSLRAVSVGRLWLPSHFAGSCGGAPISVLRMYIDKQRSPTAR